MEIVGGVQTTSKTMCVNCLEPGGLSLLGDGSVDLVLVDLPFGVTNEPWDKPLDMVQLWKEYLRIAKTNAAFVFFSSMPFTVDLIVSNRGMFKYTMVWERDRPSGHLNAKRRPLVSHEDIVVFYRTQPTYNPQMVVGAPSHSRGKAAGLTQSGQVYGINAPPNTEGDLKYPRSVLKFARPHPQLVSTQKPVELLAYLIRTYSNAGEVVLDNTMGSGSTGVACIQEGRSFIGMEADLSRFKIAERRLAGEKW